MVVRTDFGYEAGKKMLENFKLRDNKIEPPDVYIGATIDKMKLESFKGTYIDQIG